MTNDSGFITGVTWNDVSNKPTLATVATSGSYNDLTNKPTIPTVNNATLTIQKNGTTVKTFTANASFLMFQLQLKQIPHLPVHRRMVERLLALIL